MLVVQIITKKIITRFQCFNLSQISFDTSFLPSSCFVSLFCHHFLHNMFSSRLSLLLFQCKSSSKHFSCSRDILNISRSKLSLWPYNIPNDLFLQICFSLLKNIRTDHMIFVWLLLSWSQHIILQNNPN